MRENHQKTAAVAMLAAALMIVLQVGGKATRDALYLSQYGAEQLPKAMGGAAVLAIAGSLLMGRLLLRFGPRRVVPVAYVLNALMFGVDAFCLEHSPRDAALVLYLHLGALGPLLVSGFWSLVNERFPPQIAKLHIGKIAGCAALGGIVGGVLAERVSSTWSLSAMLPVLALVSCAGAVLTRLLAPPADSPGAIELRPTSVQTQWRGVPYLKQLAALVLLTSLASGVLDFALKAEVARSTRSAEEMATFFAGFHAVVGGLVFLVQTTFSSRILQKLGISGTLAILPACIFISGLLSSAVMRLWSVVLVKGLDSTLKNSVYRAGYELLYTPLSPSKKRATKTLIDVGADRAGDLVAAAAISGSIYLFPQAGTHTALLLAAAAAFACLGLAMKLHQGYIRELTVSLRTGIVTSDQLHATDATTERTLTDTTMALDREHLLREIRALQEKKKATSSQMQEQEAAPRQLTTAELQVLERIEQLSCGDLSTQQLLLAQDDLQAPLLPWILPLLASTSLRRQARHALQALGEYHSGQLLDALLGTSLSLAARAQLPKVLEQFPTERVRNGLLLAQADDNFTIRFKSARSLLRLVEREAQLAPSSNEIYALVNLETALSAEAWATCSNIADSHDSLRPEAPNIAPARLRHVITLLSCHLERDPLQLCLQAFASDQDSLTSTAHEYLENVLPAVVYRGLRPHLVESKSHRKARRAKSQIVEDLSRSTVSNNVKS